MDEKNQLTIAFHPDGTVQHTLNDGFMKLDLGVARSVKRMSDIHHEDAIGCHYIIGTLAPIKGQYFDRDFIDGLHVSMDGIPHTTDRRGVLLFTDYNDAVRCEIRVTDAMRLRGDIIENTPAYTHTIDLSANDTSGDE